MKSPSQSWNQQLAILRRHIIVVFRYPIRNLLRVLIWPLIILGPVIYLVVRTEPGSYSFGTYISYVPAIVKFTTLYHVVSIAESLVSDKATGMKSLMISMGLGRINYYSAMALCFNMYVLPNILIIMAITKSYLLDDSVNYLLMLSISILFVLQLDALIAAGVSLITSSSYAFLIPSVIFFGEPLIEPLVNVITKSVGASWNPLVLFVASVSPYEVLRLFFYDYASNHRVPDDKEEYMTQPIYLLVISQIFWTLSLRIFAYWFEEVCPWQNVSAVQNYCFCIATRSKKKHRAEESSPDVSAKTSKFFEQRPGDSHEVGIQVNHVTKTYNKQPAVNDLSFTVYKSETTLLLGHNGAGKSTLMNIILGMLEPDNGYVKFKTSSGEASPSIGVCPQTSVLDDDLTVKQHLELFNDIKSIISGNERVRHVYQTIGDVSLAGHESKRPPELSGGMKRKLSLGIAFVGKSDILILDEPSSGLDPDSRMFVWNAIRRYRSDRTVLLSTQHMEEADYLGDRIAIMSSGRIVCCGSSMYLNKLFGTGYKLRIECRLSKRKQIADHVRKHYFDAIQPVEVITDSQKRTNDDPVVDLILELKTNDKNKDPELELIKLLEDFENNSESLSIRSYGLKSSSIEDVMLNTSKYFASSDLKESTQLLMSSTSGQISALTSVRSKSTVSFSDLLWALLIKHVQVNRANWFLVLFLRVALPAIDIYLIMRRVKSSGEEIFWQFPDSAFIVGHLIYFPVKERTSKFKIMQSTSNATTWIYWMAQILFDILWLIVPLIIINISAASLSDRSLVQVWELHGLITLATVCFYISSMFFSYCLSTVITNARASIGYSFIIAVLSQALGLVIWIFRVSVYNFKGEWMQTIVNYLGVAILPYDAFAFFFTGLPAKCYITPFTENCIEKPGSSPVLIALIAMCSQMVFYSLILVLIEAQSIDIEWYFRLKNIFPCFNSSRSTVGDNREVDRDVIEETAKALAAIKDPHCPYALVAAKLNKSYIKHNNIIENLSFTVNKGECFGLLGVNGAGKTTTFSMLATETAPDSGRILANGHYNDENLNEYRKKLGYDPQATPEMSLTPYQALSLMARLRGVDDVSIPLVVKSVLDLLEMSQHTNKYDGQLSGGTKRKLALGMSLIGNPAVLALDEPTAGVDPLARRSIWQLLKSLRTHNDSSIIISSHAMEECEAICDRITIMARGRLRCIGSFLHLRTKFAKGCTLRIQFAGSFSSSSSFVETERHGDTDQHDRHGGSDQSGTSLYNLTGQRRRSSNSSLASTDKIVEELQQQLVASIGPSIFSLADRNVNSVTFDITDNRVRRSILFRMMRDFRQKHPNISYVINDTSLEDIFISLAQEQQELERQAQIT